MDGTQALLRHRARREHNTDHYYVLRALSKRAYLKFCFVLCLHLAGRSIIIHAGPTGGAREAVCVIGIESQAGTYVPVG